MKAYQIEHHGGGEVLQIVDLPEPRVSPGHVAVRVTHVGLNHLDIWVRRGVDSHHFPLPLIPGSDIAGLREDTGEAVVLHPGFGCLECETCDDGQHNLCRWYAIRGETVNGGMCERIVVPESISFHAPFPEQAAALESVDRMAHACRPGKSTQRRQVLINWRIWRRISRDTNCRIPVLRSQLRHPLQKKENNASTWAQTTPGNTQSPEMKFETGRINGASTS